MSSLLNPVIGHSIVAAATFFLIPTLGEIYAERSGILNLGIEGMIVSSAAGSYAVAYMTGEILLGILFGMLLGAAMSCIHAVISITFNRNQIVSGIGLTIFGTGLSGFLGKSVVGKALKGLPDLPIPLLSDLPFIGRVLFQHNILVYLSFALVPILWFVLYKTRVGIIIRTTGENPAAAKNQGFNVTLIRYLCVMFGGLTAGLAGAYLSLGWLNFWSEGMTQSRGWIVIALVVVALWNPLGAILGSYVFGFFDVVQYSFQQTRIPFLFPGGIPTAMLKMLPPVTTILFLAIWALILSQQKIKSTIGAPTSLAVPFED